MLLIASQTATGASAEALVRPIAALALCGSFALMPLCVRLGHGDEPSQKEQKRRASLVVEGIKRVDDAHDDHDDDDLHHHKLRASTIHH
eukprot:4741446-Prymnesium_polylepis.2